MGGSDPSTAQIPWQQYKPYLIGEGALPDWVTKKPEGMTQEQAALNQERATGAEGSWLKPNLTPAADIAQQKPPTPGPPPGMPPQPPGPPPMPPGGGLDMGNMQRPYDTGGIGCDGLGCYGDYLNQGDFNRSMGNSDMGVYLQQMMNKGGK